MCKEYFRYVLYLTEGYDVQSSLLRPWQAANVATDSTTRISINHHSVFSQAEVLEPSSLAARLEERS